MCTWQRDNGLEEESKRSMAEAIKNMREDIDAAEWVREYGGLEQVKHDLMSNKNMYKIFNIMYNLFNIFAFLCGVLAYVAIFILNDMDNGLKFVCAFTACTFAMVIADRYGW